MIGPIIIGPHFDLKTESSGLQLITGSTGAKVHFTVADAVARVDGTDYPTFAKAVAAAGTDGSPAAN